MSEDHLGALPRGFRLHEYRIERVLGHGGFGITYLASDTHLEKPVAIKEYIPSDFAVRSGGVSVRPKSDGARQNYEWGLERFIQEAQTLARFHHKNIISVLRFFEDNGTAYMVMEYEDGESLAQRLDRRRRLSEPELAGILFPLLDGLEEIHRAGILHRDIKPGNIYIRADGTPVLIDFGAARQAVGNRSKSLTALVSVGYSPYEQYTAKAEQGPFTDIYSLAAVGYHAITARPPPDAPDRMRKDDMVPAVVAGRGHFRPDFLAALDRGLAVDEEDRPQSISAWRRMLEGAAPAVSLRVDAEPITLNTGERERTDGAAGQRRSGAALAIAVLVLLSSGGAGLYAYQQNLDKQALELALVAERQTAETRQREALEEAERRAEESRQEAARAAREQAESEAAAKRKSDEAKRKAAEQARKRAEEKRLAAAAARRRAEEAARREAEEAAQQAEVRRSAEEAARRKAEEAARLAEAKRQADAAARRKAEDDAKLAESERRAREAARRQAEAEAARQADEQARREAQAAEKARQAQTLTASRTQTGSYGGTTIAAQSCVPGSRRLVDVRIERDSRNRRQDFSDATCRDSNLFVDDVKRVGSKLRWTVPLVKSKVSCECRRPGAPTGTQSVRRQGNAVTGTRIAGDWCRPGSERLVTSRVDLGSAWKKSDFSNQDCRKQDYYVRDIRRSGENLFWSVPFTKAALDCSCKRPAGTTPRRTASAQYSGERIKSDWCVPGSQRLTGKEVAATSAVGAGQFSDRDCRNPSYTVRGLRAAGGQLQWNVPFLGANISCACARK